MASSNDNSKNTKNEDSQEEEFDTLGIPIKKLPKKEEPSLIEEAEEMAESHISSAMAVFYVFLIVVIMLFQLNNLNLFDFVGAIISAIFILWAGFISETFPIYQYISMSVMFVLFLIFRFIM
jgi:hypothetical protein